MTASDQDSQDRFWNLQATLMDPNERDAMLANESDKERDVMLANESDDSDTHAPTRRDLLKKSYVNFDWWGLDLALVV